MNKVFLCGYYGFKNMGDEALLQSVYSVITDLDKDLEIEALSYNLKYTETVLGIKGFSRKSFIKLIIKIFNSDFIIFGGGSILQDVTSSKSLLYYLGIIFLGKFFGKPVALIGNGFGPVNKTINKKLVKGILNKVDYISIRDKSSFEKMKSIGIKTNMVISSDASFMISDWNKVDNSDFLISEKIPLTGKIVGISIRPWRNSEDYIDEIAGFADYLTDRGYGVLFIPMQYPIDVEISQTIVSKMKSTGYVLKNEYSPNEIIKIISKLYLVVGMRLHSLIFSTIAKIPGIAIEYDPKIKSFAEESGIVNSGTIESLKIKHLINSFLEIESDYLGKKKVVEDSLDKFVKRSEYNKEIIIKLFTKGC